MQGSLSSEELDSWVHRPTTALRREHVGVAEAVVEIYAPSPIVDYVGWYTEGYFGPQQSPAQARLFVHEVPLELWHSVHQARLSPPLRRAVLPTAPDTICLVDDGQSAVHLLSPTGSGPQSMRVVVRILRALVLRELLGRGHLFFHAACFVLQGTAVALVGARTVGKTTTLLHALEHPGTALVSNDKVALLPAEEESERTVALGFPIQVGIRAGSVLALAEGPLRRFLTRKWSQQYGDLGARYEPGTRLQVRPQELAAASDSGVIPRCRLGMAIEPHLDPRAVTPRLEKLNRAESRAVWARNLLLHPAAVFPQQAAVADLAPRAELRIPQIPTYRLVQPPAAGPLTVRLLEDLIYRTAVGE
ncbi:hypothetical protein [Streptomyces sp. NBC_01304]|uniref:hypothetical protein n=1 Tax=Streptomyces sp. NBC_01304 TaxID=2903818 RepID=UPI002E160861|nr:hypothetical protein OG430_33355 [Streptomyces sp. NBC_01304]